MKSLSLFLGLCLLIWSCQPDEKPAESPSFDRGAFLAFQADKQIIPAYENLLQKASDLEASLQQQSTAPDSATLIRWQSAWKSLLLAWQNASLYNFGPAGESGIRKSLQEELATFPASETKINTILSSGSFNLNDFNRDARGIYALEYLLFEGSGSLTQVLSRLGNPQTLAFAKALSQDIRSRVANVHREWKSGYRDAFAANTKTDVGSSTALLYNEFVKSFEIAKNAKLGLPLGLRAGQTQAEPHLVEAFYSGYSRSALEAHLKALFDVYLGESRIGEGTNLGWKQYLENVEGGKTLVASTEAQMQAVRQSLGQVAASPALSAQIARPETLTALHTELQKLTRFYKSDMSSLLGIAITFSSGDGD